MLKWPAIVLRGGRGHGMRYNHLYPKSATRQPLSQLVLGDNVTV